MMEIRHVLVPLDRSELAEAALDYAAHVVSQEGVITLLMVLEHLERESPVVLPSGEFTAVISEVVAADEEASSRAWDAAQRYLQGMAEHWKRPHNTVQTRIAEGRPAERILEAAAELAVDVIVMSTHGRSGVSRWVFGSVAQKVLSGAPCPVFIVPQRSLGQPGE